MLLHASLRGMRRSERETLHRHWMKEIADDICDKLQRALETHSTLRNSLKNCRQEQDLRCLEDAHVIGMTTSGLARNINVLRRLPSKVMVCEEAGEVLEAHIVTALLPPSSNAHRHCQARVDGVVKRGWIVVLLDIVS